MILCSPKIMQMFNDELNKKRGKGHPTIKSLIHQVVENLNSKPMFPCLKQKVWKINIKTVPPFIE